MKGIRKTITAFISALVIALTTVMAVACGDDKDPSNIKVPPDGDGKDIKYTVTLERSGGDPFNQTLIMATGPKMTYGRTDADGVWTFTGPKGTYTLEFDVPEGYVGTHESYKIDDKTPSKKFTLSASLISDAAPASQSYTIGSVMHDFTFTDTQGRQNSLSKIFENKKAVLLNFWFVNCSWCIQEFPGMQAAYTEYKNDIEIIGLNFTDSTAASESFRVNASGSYEWDTLTFPMVGNEQPACASLATSFGITGCPTSVMIDREGVVCFIAGTGTEDEFRSEFARYTASDYVQFIQFPSKNVLEKPDVAHPSSARIAEAVAAEGFTATYYPDANEYNWPWIIAEDGNGIKAANSGKLSSFAILYADFEATANQVLAFDYKVSSEKDADLFNVFIDGTLMQTYSGTTDGYKTCYAYVPLKETGKYTLALSYTKDETRNSGEDTVYIKNMRFASEVGERTEILYRCATGGLNDNGEYNHYVTTVYNEEDGYYHVGTADGPLVIADLLNSVKWDKSAWEMVSNLPELPYKGEDLLPTFSEYVQVANKSRRKGFTGVTAELKDCLDAITDKYGTKTNNENEWLDLCYYYIVYAGEEGEQVEDPSIGLAIHNAFPATITAIGEELVLNHVTKTVVLMPRGIYYEVVPEKTAVYRIRSVGDIDSEVWVYAKNGKLIAENDNDLGANSLTDGNFSLTLSLEKDVPYYVAVDLKNIDELGEFDFVVEELGAGGTVWTPAATGPYSYPIDANGNKNGDWYVLGAVDYVLGEDQCYHVKNADGSAGALIYINMLGYTNLFPEQSVEDMLGIHGYYCKNCGIKYPASVAAFERAEEVYCYCGNSDKSRFEKKKPFELPTALYDSNKKMLTMTFTIPTGDGYDYVHVVPFYDLNTDLEFRDNIQYMQYLRQYGIKFQDYTSVIEEYVAKAKDPDNYAVDADELGGQEGEPYVGYIPASKELIDVLQKFIVFGDYAMSPQIENAWLMMSNYFLPLGE